MVSSKVTQPIASSPGKTLVAAAWLKAPGSPWKAILLVITRDPLAGRRRAFEPGAKQSQLKPSHRRKAASGGEMSQFGFDLLHRIRHETIFRARRAALLRRFPSGYRKVSR